MKGRWVWVLAKLLQGVGMVLVLWGLVHSIVLGMEDEALESMRYEMNGLLWGGAVFVAGWLLERASGGR